MTMEVRIKERGFAFSNIAFEFKLIQTFLHVIRHLLMNERLLAVWAGAFCVPFRPIAYAIKAEKFMALGTRSDILHHFCAHHADKAVLKWHIQGLVFLQLWIAIR